MNKKNSLKISWNIYSVFQDSWASSTCCCSGPVSCCSISPASRPLSSPASWSGPTSWSTAWSEPSCLSSCGSGERSEVRLRSDRVGMSDVFSSAGAASWRRLWSGLWLSASPSRSPSWQTSACRRLTPDLWPLTPLHALANSGSSAGPVLLAVLCRSHPRLPLLLHCCVALPLQQLGPGAAGAAPPLHLYVQEAPSAEVRQPLKVKIFQFANNFSGKAEKTQT